MNADLHGASVVGTRLELGGAAVEDEFALVDDDYAAADGLDFFEDVRGNDDGLALAHVADEHAHLVLLVGVQAVCRFVKHQHRRVVKNRLGKAAAVEVAFGQGVDALSADFLQVAGLDRLLDRVFLLIAAEAADGGAEGQEVLDGHVVVRRGVFWQVAEESFGRDGGRFDVVAANFDFAAGEG